MFDLQGILSGLLGSLGLGGGGQPFNAGIINIDTDEEIENTIQSIMDNDEETDNEYTGDVRNNNEYKKRSASERVSFC